MIDKWDKRFMETAEHVSLWSKDPSLKVGAVIVRPDRTIASIGYNGFPRGCDDSPEVYADRATKLSRVVHAELNAILNARGPVDGCTIYINCIGGSCDRCAAHIVQAGITRQVCLPISDDFRWKESMEAGRMMFDEANVEVVELDFENDRANIVHSTSNIRNFTG